MGLYDPRKSRQGRPRERPVGLAARPVGLFKQPQGPGSRSRRKDEYGGMGLASEKMHRRPLILPSPTNTTALASLHIEEAEAIIASAQPIFNAKRHRLSRPGQREKWGITTDLLLDFAGLLLQNKDVL